MYSEDKMYKMFKRGSVRAEGLSNFSPYNIDVCFINNDKQILANVSQPLFD